MVDLNDRLRLLTAQHRSALEWFRDRAGNIEPWPAPLPGGTFLASKAKGIYKPAWSTAALSVRQNLDGPYADRDPITRADGTWSYCYFQENPDPARRDDEFTNRGLMQAHSDGIPVGVLRQTRRSPSPRYEILGLAMVAGWEEGYFFLEGFSPGNQAYGNGPAALIDGLVHDAEAGDPGFDPANILDGRERAMASVVRRRGQPAFRRELIQAYDGRCAFTGCDTLEALDAAHISPYRGTDTNHVTNGLLLRTDLHALFDLGLIAVDSGAMVIVISDRLVGSPTYGYLAGQVVTVPRNPAERPNLDALEYHRIWTGL